MSSDLTLRELCHLAHENAKTKGFWEPWDRNVPEMLMLSVSELVEALEEYRGGRTLTEVYEDENGKPMGFPTEIADVFIRLGDLCERYGIDITEVIQQKMAYNVTRPRRHGGKKC